MFLGIEQVHVIWGDCIPIKVYYKIRKLDHRISAEKGKRIDHANFFILSLWKLKTRDVRN